MRGRLPLNPTLFPHDGSDKNERMKVWHQIPRDGSKKQAWGAYQTQYVYTFKLGECLKAWMTSVIELSPVIVVYQQIEWSSSAHVDLCDRLLQHIDLWQHSEGFHLLHAWRFTPYSPPPPPQGLLSCDNPTIQTLVSARVITLIKRTPASSTTTFPSEWFWCTEGLTRQ